MKILNQEVKNVSVDDLTSHPKNPRRGNVESIKESIEFNGFYGVVIAQKSTGHILAGNHRWKAAKESGADEIPVIWLDVDDDHALRILLADNKTNDLAEYDEGLLNELLSDLAENSSLEGTGFTNDDLGDLLDEISEEDVELFDLDKDSILGSKRGTFLKYGNKTIPISEEEVKLLEDKFKFYTNRFGLEFGFIRWLTDG